MVANLDAKHADQYTKNKIKKLGPKFSDFVKAAFKGNMFGFGPGSELGIAGDVVKGLAGLKTDGKTHKAPATNKNRGGRGI